MAKIYGQIAAAGKMTFDKSFSRMNGQPLDASEVYYSLADAEAYAATSAAYVGQKIVVVDEENGVVKHYGVEVDGSLKELGAATLGDNKTIELDEGILSLKNWGKEYYKWIDANGDDPNAEDYVAGHYEKYVLAEGEAWPAGLEPKAATAEDGTVVLGWYQASNQTSQQISNTVGQLSNTVETLANSIGSAEDAPTEETVYGALNAIKKEFSDFETETLPNLLDVTEDSVITGALTVENTVDVIGDMSVTGKLTINNEEVATKNYVDGTIATQISEANHLKRVIVDVLPSVEEAKENIIYMIKSGLALTGDKYQEYMLINGDLEMIGDTSVDLTNYVQKVENATLNNLAALAADGALIDAGIALQDVVDHLIDDEKHITAEERAAWDSGAALATTNAAAIESLVKITQNDADKLAALPGIKSIGANLVLGEDGVLSAVAEQYKLPAATAESLGGVKVGTGLAIDAEGVLSVPVVEANGLALTNDGISLALASSSAAGALSSELFEKLSNIEIGAQANVIDGILLAGTEATIQGKKVSIPFASTTNVGLVLGSTDDNKISVADDGTMEVNRVSVAKLYVPDDVELILDGGNA